MREYNLFEDMARTYPHYSKDYYLCVRLSTRKALISSDPIPGFLSCQGLPWLPGDSIRVLGYAMLAIEKRGYGPHNDYGAAVRALMVDIEADHDAAFFFTLPMAALSVNYEDMLDYLNKYQGDLDKIAEEIVPRGYCKWAPQWLSYWLSDLLKARGGYQREQE